MGKSGCSDERFIQLFKDNGPAETAKILDIDVRCVYQRRRNIEARYNIILNPGSPWSTSYPVKKPYKILDGIVIVGSDVHIWPDCESVAQKAFIKLCKELNPELVCLNGDVFDGARISRHPAIGWEKKPTVKQEMDSVSEWVTKVEEASRRSKHLWNIGNHDQRFENTLSNKVGEFEDVAGFSLKEHFPKWDFAVSAWINNEVVIKHRMTGGIHATRNNTVKSGKTIITGHLHQLKVTPLADYNGNRFGVDTGTMAETNGPQFNYCEDNQLDWRSGFVVLTFHKGKLLWPEIVHVLDECSVEFRGKVIDV